MLAAIVPGLVELGVLLAAPIGQAAGLGFMTVGLRRGDDRRARDTPPPLGPTVSLAPTSRGGPGLSVVGAW